jgi:hypothetical protein
LFLAFIHNFTPSFTLSFSSFHLAHFLLLPNLSLSS